MFDPIPLDIFRERIGTALNGYGFNEFRDIESIVSLRDIHSIISISAMRKDYLMSIIKNIKTRSGEKVYKNCSIATARLAPDALEIGQTFVQRDKYIAILENFKSCFRLWTMPGIAKLTPQIIIGHTIEGKCVLAHYLPPIVEIHDDHLVIMDGIHRNFLGLSIGSTVECIIVKDISVPFPCSLRKWGEISVVEKKPPPEERYFNLKEEFFRDLKTMGVDG